MSPLELAYRAALRAVPNFRFGHDQLVRLLSALPPPPADAPVAFRHRHIRGIIQEVRALDPVNPLEAMLVEQIIAYRHAAADCARRSLDPTLPVQDVARLFRCMEMMERSTRQMERVLKKQQAGRVPVRQSPEGQVPGDQASGGQAPAQVEFDVEALDAAWRDMHYPVVEPVVESDALQSASGAPIDVASTAPPPVTLRPTLVPAPAERTKFTLCGQRIDLVKLATIPAAGAA
jgi:hypothetical protein